MSDTPQPLTEHLEELRWRLLKTLAAVGALFGVAYGFSGHLMDVLSAHAGKLVFVRPAEAFLVRIKLSAYAALFASTPVMLYQAWAFVSLGLTREERRTVLRFLPLSYALFLTGAAMAWFVIVPMAVTFLLGFGTETLQPFLSADAYLSFIGWMVLAFGGMFQMPIVIYVLALLGFVDARTLGEYRRHVFVAILVVAALATPPDVVSQLALAIPTYLLYEVSVWMVRARGARGQAAPGAG